MSLAGIASEPSDELHHVPGAVPKASVHLVTSLSPPPGGKSDHPWREKHVRLSASEPGEDVQVPLSDSEGTVWGWEGWRPGAGELEAVRHRSPILVSNTKVGHWWGAKQRVVLREYRFADGTGEAVATIRERDQKRRVWGALSPSGTPEHPDWEDSEGRRLRAGQMGAGALPPRCAVSLSGTADQRARREIRRYIGANNLADMITYTYPGKGVHDYDEHLRLMRNFKRRHGKALQGGGPYILVPEEHPGGHGWHWHEFVRPTTRKAVTKLRVDHWTPFLLRQGHELPRNTRSVRVHHEPYESLTAAANYGSKYVTKAYGHSGIAPGRNRYMRSIGYNPEPQELVFDCLDDAKAYMEARGYDRVIDGREKQGGGLWISGFSDHPLT